MTCGFLLETAKRMQRIPVQHLMKNLRLAATFEPLLSVVKSVFLYLILMVSVWRSRPKRAGSGGAVLGDGRST